MNDKISAILGLAMRGRKLVLGIDNIEAYKGRIYCAVCDGSLSEKSQKNIAFISSKIGAALIMSAKAVEDITGKKGCKACALTDKNMYDGIVMALPDSEGYKILNNR